MKTLLAVLLLAAYTFALNLEPHGYKPPQHHSSTRTHVVCPSGTTLVIGPGFSICQEVVPQK